MKSTIEVGNYAGGRCCADYSLRLAYHVVRTYADGEQRRGYLVRRKWVDDEEANALCPTQGLAIEHWLEWCGD